VSGSGGPGRPRVVDFHTHARIDMESLDPWKGYISACGIDRLVLLTDVLAFGPAPTLEQVRAINTAGFALPARHPDLCASFCFLNPTLEPRSMIDELERCRALGAVGAKMEVSAWADDARLDPIMRHLDQVRMPLLHHSWNTRSLGRINPPGYYQSDPDEVAALAARFPRVTIIAAHLRPGGLRGIWALREHTNVHYDTSGGQPLAGVVEAAVRLLGAERVLYGSDMYFPGGRDGSCQLANVLAARISDREKELVLAGNADRLLAGALS
jgi:uncharacterized protein